MKVSAVAWVFKRYRILITLMTLISCVAGFVYSMYVMKPVYTSKVLMMITTVDELMIQKFDYVTILANRQLVQPYTEIMQSNKVLERIAAELGNSITTEQLSAALSVSQVGGTEIIEISVRDNEPQQAANIANTTANVFIQHIGETFKVNNLKILDTAVPGKAPVQSSRLLHTIVATLLGLALAVAAALTYAYIRQPVGMPGVLDGEVKLLARMPQSKLLRNNLEKAEEALNNKAIKNCYLFLQTLLVEKAAQGKAILLTSITPQENTLTIAKGLVVTLIQSGYRVTFVNTDFSVKNQVIPYMLQGEVHSKNIPVTGGSLVQRHSRAYPGLIFVDVAERDVDGYQFIAANDLTTILKKTAPEADVVLINGSSLSQYAEATLLATRADHVLLVAGSNTPAEKFKKGYAALNAVQAGVLGVVINEC